MRVRSLRIHSQDEPCEWKRKIIKSSTDFDQRKSFVKRNIRHKPTLRQINPVFDSLFLIKQIVTNTFCFVVTTLIISRLGQNLMFGLVRMEQVERGEKYETVWKKEYKTQSTYSIMTGHILIILHYHSLFFPFFRPKFSINIILCLYCIIINQLLMNGICRQKKRWGELLQCDW